MTSGKHVLLAGLPLLCCLGVSAQIMPSAPAFYVSTSGNDANPGTLSAPWRTVHAPAFRVATGQSGGNMSDWYAEFIRRMQAVSPKLSAYFSLEN